MITEKFPHKQFLEENVELIQQHPIPEALQKRIEGFNLLEQDLANTTGEDFDELVDRLEDLSFELDEDLEEFFQHYEQGSATEPEPQHESEPEPGTPQLEIKVEPSRQETVPEPAKSDEQILDELLQAGKNPVWPSQLSELGFQAQLGSRAITLGKFTLRRGKHINHYTIFKKQD